MANLRGAEAAVAHPEIQYLGFPLSISESFQQRNTNKSISQALEVLQEIQNLCVKHGKTLVTYISMGFGNPYDEPFNEEIVAEFSQKLVDMKVEIISLADTIGVADPDLIQRIFKSTIASFPETEIGAHFHSTPHTAVDKIAAAYKAGCRRFDVAVKGYGGCPMAKDELTGNIATEKLLSYFDTEGVETGIDKSAFNEAMALSARVFN